MTTTKQSLEFEELVQQCGASALGSKWLKMAVDPFHDVDIEIVGMPDSTSGRSVVFNVTRNVTIQAPGTNTWSCHVSTIPLVHQGDLEMYRANLISGAGSGVKDVDLTLSSPTAMTKASGAGFVTACSIDSGTSSDTFQGAAGEVYQGVGFSDLLDVDGRQSYRCIGGAFEVTNTTEELHKSGSVTAYKFPIQPDMEHIHLKGGSSTSYGVHSIPVISGPPANEADAKLMNGVTWEAADGCLVPILLDPEHPEPTKFHNQVCAMRVESGGVISYWMMSDLENKLPSYTTTPTFSLPTGNLEHNSIHPMNVSGAYFTGLSPETTLVLTCRLFIEVFPAPGNSLVPLAHPAPPLDTEVMECYARIMSEMHPGYPVHDNAAGDYFKKALQTVRTIVRAARPYVKPVLGAVATVKPELAPLAAAASAGMDAADALPAKRKKSRKKSRR